MSMGTLEKLMGAIETREEELYLRFIGAKDHLRCANEEYQQALSRTRMCRESNPLDCLISVAMERRLQIADSLRRRAAGEFGKAQDEYHRYLIEAAKELIETELDKLSTDYLMRTVDVMNASHP